jgi:hypothetical protein
MRADTKEAALMTRPKRRPRGPGHGEPVQLFTWGAFDFHVNEALTLAANAAKYQPRRCRPARAWVGRDVHIDEEHVEASDTSRPVLFATIIRDGRPASLLIDGNHRVLKALRHRDEVRAIHLDLADTLAVMQGPAGEVEQMRRDGQRLGLLPAGRDRGACHSAAVALQ